MRSIRSMEEKYRLAALELVEAVFTASESPEEGKLVRRLVEEIRGKRFYLLQLMSERGYCVRALARRSQLSESAVSQHLKILREAGACRTWRQENRKLSLSQAIIRVRCPAGARCR